MNKTHILSIRHPFLLSLAVLPLVLAAALAGCAAERPYVWARDVPATPAEAVPVVHARDSVMVFVQEQTTLSGEYIVREDGGFVHPALGNVSVEGKTPAQVTEMLQSMLTTMVVHPRVAVSISRRASARVNVVGEVKTPGTYELTRDRSVTAALAAAGWLTVFAAEDRIFVIRPTDQGMRIRFKARDLTTPDPQSVSFRLRDGDVVVVE